MGDVCPYLKKRHTKNKSGMKNPENELSKYYKSPGLNQKLSE
jgi:hypothetical protein